MRGKNSREKESLLIKVYNVIKKYNMINNGDKIILGVSGGPDSICMLKVLNDIRNDKNLHIDFDIIVAHVNHLIREEAYEDEEFVKNFCEKISVPFYSKRIDVLEIANNTKVGTEEAGRNVRYEFFNDLLKETKSNKIAIAHNKNDKVETVIMNIIRGSGISGLKGIEAVKDDKIIRPLIECERSEIEEYCLENSIEPRIDKTNFENVYSRNKVRNIVIPFIKKEFNQNIVQTIERLSELVEEEEAYFEKEISKIYNSVLLEENENEKIFDLKKFNQYEKVIKSRLIFFIINKLNGNTMGIEKIHVEDLIKLCEKNIGNKYLMPNKNLKVLVKDGKIYFIKKN